MAVRLDTGCTCGGILKLRELIEEHPAELAYDFRTRFNLSFEDIGYSVTFLEAALLVSVLMRSPDSWLQAVKSGWQYPVSREWIVSSHTYDLHALANSGKGKKPKPYPNPFPDKTKVRTGNTRLSRREVIAVLNKMNPKED